ncbi:Tetratricopeptide repeat-containing protein [Anaerocolumna jejuensis DSM 15929]|uniref:Tetratricopeptide repeat-containing protein n=1 Tax=Anaerocolumna jejuensis DSM 15929 TaxID=1121322 RepID=A0A1M7DKF3_9FIRM|nr:ATP-binding protein [Anaerocolumna jejuensis]SHL79878.1 Tetratricopeptide repeat-containing protein [Anaerocolumna jejuensis DSM 15929]
MIKLAFDARDYGYTIISRFEKTLRNYLNNELLTRTDNIMNLIPTGVIEAGERRINNNSDFNDILENIDFIHLKEIIIYKDNYVCLYDSSKLDKKDFINIMDSLYELRCKIAHIRGFFTNSDLNNLYNEVMAICVNMIHIDEDFLMFLNVVLTTPEELVEKVPLDFLSDSIKNYEVLNNIPIADYEYEGGFVGRNDDKEKIIKMLEDGMHRVITISGAGGVGKSALVLNIVNDILRKKIIKYDCVIWVSAKENKLTYLGIEDIEPTLKSYEELLDTILDVMGFDYSSYITLESKEEDVNILFDACDKVLLVIDNLETITDDRIINFILDSHTKTNILITSRRGLGQVERRYDLKQLKEKEAIHLFRTICREKNLVKLIACNETIIKLYVNKVYCYPLAIKWVLGQVAIGKDINNLIDNINESTSDISQFCFEQIYSDLTREAKVILCTLSLYEDNLSKGILKYISNLNEVIFEDSIKSLVLVSIIIPEQTINKDNQQISTLYSLLPLTRGYVKAQLDKESILKQQIQDRMLTVDNTLEEAERAQKQYRYSLSNLGANTEEEKVAAMLAQTAYQKYQAGNYLDAVESYKRAIEIAPRFSSIYRNWAVMESIENHWLEADSLMDKAVKYSPEDVQIWLSWGNIKRKNDKIKDAFSYYSKAYELNPDDNVVLNSYALALSRMGEYEKADNLMNKALNMGEGKPNNRHLIINYTSIAENLKKWAEAYSFDKDYKKAEEKLKIALHDMELAVKIDDSDIRSSILYREILIDLGYLMKNMKQFDKAEVNFRKVIKSSTKKFREMEIYSRAIIGLLDLFVMQEKIDEVKKIIYEGEKIIKRVGKSQLYKLN